MTESLQLFSSNYLNQNLEEKSGIKFRPLNMNDYQKGFCEILSELTLCKTTEDKFEEIFNKIFKINSVEPQYFIVVGEDIQNGKIAVAGSIIIEKKFIHYGQCVGHIEDIVVSSNYRGKGLGEHLISILKDIGKKDCYKIILDCEEEKLGFYSKCGFSKKSVGMAKYF